MSDDDPFASGQSRQSTSDRSSESGEYANPDNVDLDMNGDNGRDDEIDSDEAFGDGDQKRFQDYTFRGCKKVHKKVSDDEHVVDEVEDPATAEDDGGFSGLESDEMDDYAIVDGDKSHDDRSAAGKTGLEEDIDDSDDVEMEDHDSGFSEAESAHSGLSSSNTDDNATTPPADNDRAVLRQMMAESQKTITSNLTRAAKSDIAKGRAIRQQRTTFDSLLNIRIRLQKALIATNSLQPSTMSSTNTPDPAIQAAEQAAMKLWSKLDTLRESLHPISPSPQPPLEPSPSTPLSTLWTRMQSH